MRSNREGNCAARPLISLYDWRTSLYAVVENGSLTSDTLYYRCAPPVRRTDWTQYGCCAPPGQHHHHHYHSNGCVCREPQVWHDDSVTASLNHNHNTHQSGHVDSKVSFRLTTVYVNGRLAASAGNALSSFGFICLRFFFLLNGNFVTVG